jgi:hypothetical protein
MLFLRVLATGAAETLKAMVGSTWAVTVAALAVTQVIPFKVDHAYADTDFVPVLPLTV